MIDFTDRLIVKIRYRLRIFKKQRSRGGQVEEANELLRQLKDFRADCAKKIKEGERTRAATAEFITSITVFITKYILLQLPYLLPDGKIVY